MVHALHCGLAMQNLKALAFSVVLMLGAGCGVTDPTADGSEDEAIAEDQDSVGVDIDEAMAEGQDADVDYEVSPYCDDNMLVMSMNAGCVTWDWATICALTGRC